MAAYCLFDNLEVLDAGKLEEYKGRVRPVVENSVAAMSCSAAKLI